REAGPSLWLVGQVRRPGSDPRTVGEVAHRRCRFSCRAYARGARAGGRHSMKTAITEMFGIDVPILAFTHCRDVAAAVTKAGGMGVLGAVAHSPEQLEIDLAWIEKEVGGRPYGIDVIVPAKYAGS